MVDLYQALRPTLDASRENRESTELQEQAAGDKTNAVTLAIVGLPNAVSSLPSPASPLSGLVHAVHMPPTSLTVPSAYRENPL